MGKKMTKAKIIFGMPDEEYHSIAALSASGIKNILISPMDFWARSWMAPDFLKEENTEACKIGRAYHKRILEGKDAFDASYVRSFNAPEGCLRTKEEIKTELEHLGIMAPKSSKKEDLIELAKANGVFNILELCKDIYEENNSGKEQLSSELVDRIEIAAAMIEKHPELSKCFSGGYPEVSIFWEEDGINFKARLDYLKTKAVIDLKTFSNYSNKPIERAIYGSMAAGKYHIQAAFYLHAIDIAKNSEMESWGNSADNSVINGPSKEWLEELAKCEKHDFYSVFQQKGIAPVARAFKFGQDRAQGMMGAANSAIEQAIYIFKKYSDYYGDDPWVDLSNIQEFHDDEFPSYATEL